jgi:uncharacterized membrane protein YdjX (TVP38/TMEM64 family)
VRSRPISIAKWFSAFGAYIAVLSLLLLWTANGGQESLKDLVFFTIYVSFACTFCPLPILWIFLWIARDHSPLVIALLGSIATCIANLHDYHILNSLLRWKRLSRARDARWYKRGAEWFSRYPFWTLAGANFLPLPVDFVRLLAISTGYSRIAFTLANFIGRFPRYLILAVLGYELKLSNKAILIVLLATVTIAAIKSLPKLKDRIKNRHRPEKRDVNP